MSSGDRRTTVVPIAAVSFALILIGAAALAAGLFVGEGSARLVLVSLVSSLGGLLLLWMGVLRLSGPPPSAG